MRGLTDDELASFRSVVEHNCAISDARYARDYSLCIYLLRMREYYRWQHQLPLAEALSIERVGDWVSEKEFLWDDIEETDFQPVNLFGKPFDPFDHRSINQYLTKQGLVYSAGLGRMGQPHFAIATLLDQSSQSEVELYHCGQELVRDIVTVPAMSQGNTVFIRHDGIYRYLWELYDDWLLHRKPGPMARLVSHYGFKRDETLEASLRVASEDVAIVVEMHERGEVAAAKILGPEYSEITTQAAGTRDEVYLRTTRDLMADTLCTWPYLIEQKNGVLLDFYLAGVSGLRLSLLEQLGLYQELTEGPTEQRLRFLEKHLESEHQRWLKLCLSLKALLQQQRQEKCVASKACSDNGKTVPNCKQLVDEWLSTQTKTVN